MKALFWMMLWSVFVPIRRITFEGNRVFSDATLLLVSGLEQGQPYRFPLVFRARRALEEQYHMKGYFQVRIRVDTQRVEDGVDVHFIIHEGRRSVIQSIWADPGPLLSSQAFLRMFPHGGKNFPYDEGILNRAETKVAEIYQNQGFPYVQVSRVLDTLSSGRVNLRYTVHPGPWTRIDEIQVVGNHNVRTALVLRALGLRPPVVYAQRRLEEGLRTLYRLELFRLVRYRLDTLTLSPRQDTLRLRLVVLVEERPPKYLRVGMGVQTPDRIQGRLTLGHRSLFYNGQNEEVTLESALQFPQFIGDFQQGVRVIRGRLRHKEPFFLNTPARGEFTAGYDFDREILSRAFSFTFLLGIEVSPSLLWTPTLTWTRETWRGQGVTNLLATPLYLDTRDNLFNPHRGAFGLFSVQYAGGILRGNHHFTRYYGMLSLFQSLGDVVLAVRGVAGWLDPRQALPEIPLTYFFRLGGDGSIRGYPLGSLGPLHPAEESYRYGTAMLNGNLELRIPWHPILWKGGNPLPLGVVLFLDAGRTGLRFPPPPPTYITAGVGLRIHAFATPLRLDWGYPLTKAEGAAPGGAFYVGIGHMF